MKRLLRTTLLVGSVWIGFLSSTLAFALEFSEFGIFNLNFAHVSQTSLTGFATSPTMTWGAGISVGITLSGPWVLEPGLNYISRSHKQRSNTTPETIVQSTSVDLPILIRYRLTPTLSFALGPVFSVLAGQATLNTGGSSTRIPFGNLPRNRNSTAIAVSARYLFPLNELMNFITDI